MPSRIKLLKPTRVQGEDEDFPDLPDRDPDHVFKFKEFDLSGEHEVYIWYVGDKTYVTVMDYGGAPTVEYSRRVEPWEIIGDLLLEAAIAQGFIEGEDLLDPQGTWVRE